jgi:hypothetical protein
MRRRAAEAWSWAAVVIAPIRDDRVVAVAKASSVPLCVTIAIVPALVGAMVVAESVLPVGP